MGKFKDHVLFAAFLFTVSQLAFGQYVFAFDYVPVLPTLANAGKLGNEQLSDCQPQNALPPWITPTEDKVKQGGRS